jgi:hypothetical protein
MHLKYSSYIAGYQTAETVRYKERSTVERVNGRLKDEYGGRVVRVKGAAKDARHTTSIKNIPASRCLDELFSC